MLDRLNAIKFVMLVSFVSSLVLALLYSTLINRVEENIRLDKKQSILRVIGINSSNLSSEEVNLKYKEHINEFVINTDGEIVDIPLSEIVWKENKSDWNEADKLRGKIENLGWLIEDTKDGQKLIQKK